MDIFKDACITPGQPQPSPTVPDSTMPLSPENGLPCGAIDPATTDDTFLSLIANGQNIFVTMLIVSLIITMAFIFMRRKELRAVEAAKAGVIVHSDPGASELEKLGLIEPKNTALRDAGWYPTPEGFTERYWSGDTWEDVYRERESDEEAGTAAEERLSEEDVERFKDSE